MWTRVLSPFIVLGRSLLPSSCATLKLKEKRVSVRFVSIDFLVLFTFYFFYFLFFYFNKCFPFVEIMTKFNKDMYAKMRTKKDEPLSSLRKKTVRVTGKGPSVTPTTSITPIVSDTETVRTTFPATSVEEIPTPASKRSRVTDKGKEKADSRSSSVWDDEGLAVEKAHGAVIAKDLKVILGVSFKEVTTRHVHKLVQVTFSCNF